MHKYESVLTKNRAWAGWRGKKVLSVKSKKW